jgi:predicted MFS family arabinose efflux permease
LGAALASGLLALTEGPERGWDAPLLLASVGVAVLSFAGFVARQWKARDPFVPRSLLRNAAYVRLGAVTLLLVGVNITVQVTLPLPLAEVGGLRPPEVGLALLPPALATVACGPLAGALVDRSGLRLPILASASLVVAALFCLSAFGIAGPVWVASVLAALVSVGATVAKVGAQTGISLAVRKGDLPSAISVSEMLWIVGTSLGSALFAATYDARADASSAINPAYGGPTDLGAVGYSDAFLALAVPLVVALLVSLGLNKVHARP